MIKNVEITGKILESDKGFKVGLYVKDAALIDWFVLNLSNNKSVFSLGDYTRKLLLMNDTYDAHMQLVKDLGLEIPTGYKKHWIPSPNDKYFCIDSTGEVYEFSCSDNERIENYNTFPTRELAEKACNLSKLGRLILLWQYANDCIFTPDWSDYHQPKYNFYYNNRVEVFEINFYCRFQYDVVSFETKEQARAFVKMYEEELKEIMGISQC